MTANASGDGSLDRYARLVQQLLGAPIGLVTLVETGRQVFLGQVGLAPPLDEVRQTPLSHSFCQHVVRNAEPLVVEDARVHPLLWSNSAVEDLGVIAYAGMPLTADDGTVLGSLCAIDHEPRRWTDEELSRLADLAVACSAELQRRLAVAEGQDTALRLGLLDEVGTAIGTTLDGAETIERLVRLVVPALGDWATAALTDVAGRTGATATRHLDPVAAGSVAVLLGAQLRTEQAGTGPARSVASVLRTGEAETIALTDQEVSGLPGPLLTVPLRGRAGPVGWLSLGREHDPYSPQEVQTALDLGRRVGLALDNAALFAQQRDNAEAFQRSLLTQLPELDRLHVHAAYRPAATGTQVGGDWYDAFLQQDGALVLAVGDVVGHDIAAAAKMSEVRNVLRVVAYDRGESPGQMLSRVDRTLTGLAVQTLATAVVARIEQTAEQATVGVRTLRWSNAGHPPPVLLLADGSVRLLDTDGELLLGVDDRTERNDHVVVLPPGTTLVLYTDGLVERRDASLDRGLARLRQALTALVDLPLNQMCDELLERMLPAGADDDVALLLVRTHPKIGPGSART